MLRIATQLFFFVLVCFTVAQHNTILTPHTLTTLKGSISKNDIISLRYKDQSPGDDNWDDYVEFNATYVNYQGIFAIDISSVDSSTVTSLNLVTNFRGDSYSGQPWQFEILNPTTNSWKLTGSNSKTTEWTWSYVSFAGTIGILDLFSNSSIYIRFSSLETGDVCDLDYLAVNLSVSSLPAPTPAPTSPPPATVGGRVCPQGTYYAPRPLTTWQIQFSGAINTSYDAQVFDIDMFDSDESLITKLHNLGRAVICYIDTAYEPYRPDAANFTAAVLGNIMEGWPDEKWVDIRSPVVRSIMSNRIAMAAAKNCDAVDMDDVDAYTNDPGFPLTYDDQLDFNRFLANEAHRLGMGIGLKNEIEQMVDLVDWFDFGVNEQCFSYDECNELLNFIEQDKAVFGIEYNTLPAEFCPVALNKHFTTVYKNMDLGFPITACCTYLNSILYFYLFIFKSILT